MPKMSKKFAAVVTLFNERGSLLLLKRAPHCRVQGWCLPGGGIEKNEPARFAASRKLKEETGIAISPNLLHYIGSHVASRGETVLVYTAEIAESSVILSNEHIDFVWESVLQNDRDAYSNLAGNTFEFMRMAVEWRRTTLAPPPKTILELEIPEEAYERLRALVEAKDPRVMQWMKDFKITKITWLSPSGGE